MLGGGEINDKPEQPPSASLELSSLFQPAATSLRLSMKLETEAMKTLRMALGYVLVKSRYKKHGTSPEGKQESKLMIIVVKAMYFKF